MLPPTRRSALSAAAVLLLLMVLAGELVTAVRGQSLTWDEGDHIFAGYMQWKTGDFGLNPEHPPLVKWLATAPLAVLPLKAPPLGHRFFKSESYLDGRAMLFGNAPRYSAESLTLRVRLAAGLLSLVLALLVFAATREMFSTDAALVALVLLVFEPNIVAHGAYVTTDLGVSCFLFAAVYAFYRYVCRPRITRMLIAGLAAGLALASKHSAVLIFPMLVLLAAGELLLHWMARRGWVADLDGVEREEYRSAAGSFRELTPVRLGAAVVGIGMLAVVVLFGFYGFRYNARPAGLHLDPTLAQYVLPLSPIEAHGILLLAKLQLLPESYLYGLADVRAMANGMPSFIFGRVWEHGVWFYFPAVFLIKSTLGFLAILALALSAIVSGQVRRPREVLFLGVPAVFYFAVAMGSSLNIGSRHILPVYVFCCALAAGGSWALTHGYKSTRTELRKSWAILVCCLLAAHVVSSLRAFPDLIAYSNEVAGGPSATYKYLTDSNTDWGQQLLAVKAYTDEHHIHDCWFAYFVTPFILPSDYGIPCKLLPTFDSVSSQEEYPVPPRIDGPVFISAGDLTGFEFGSNTLNPYTGFQTLQPSALIQHGVLVYQGSFNVPLAAAYSHVERSAALLASKDVPGALAEAQTAVSLAPAALQSELALGDAEAAAHHTTEAQAAYTHALAIVRTMQPDGQAVWLPQLEKKMGS
jgi:hypothetical protein